MPRRKTIDDYKDKIGERHGKLVIVEILERNERGRYVAKCQCDCGNIHYSELGCVLYDKVGSCGCTRKMYKGIRLRSQERLYRIYHGIRERCYNPKSPSYKNYGDRGIIVCDEWLEDYATFREWALENGYSDGLTIDRIDVNGNYEPSNCRWLNWVDQCNNKRDNFRITYNDETHTASEWSRITGIDKQRIIHRYKRNFPLDVVFSQKRLASRGHYGEREKSNSNSEIAETI